MTEDMSGWIKGVLGRYVADRCHPGSGFQRMIVSGLNPAYLDAELRVNLAEVLEMIQQEVPEEARGSEEAFRKWTRGTK